MGDYGTMTEIESALEQSSGIFGNIESILGSIFGIFSLASVGVSTMVFIIGAIVGGIIAVAYFIFESIPVYSLAKKVGYKYAWLAWMPFFHDYCRIFVLSEIAGNKPFVPNIGKFKIENRKMSFLAHIGIKYLGGTVISVVVGVVSTVLPLIGYFSVILGLVPGIACAIIEYVYLRDVIDIFKPDKKANNTAAIMVSVIDAILLGDLIRTCYLYTLFKKQPLPEEEITVEPVEATVDEVVAEETTV